MQTKHINIRGNRIFSRRVPAFYSFLLLAFCLMLNSVSPAEGMEAVGSFTHVAGKVDVLRGGAPAIAVKKGDPVFVKDIVRTKSDSKAEILFIDGNLLRLAQRTRIDISEYITDGAQTKEIIKLPRGKVEALVEKKLAQRISVSKEANKFEIHTPNAVAGVRGTDYFVFHSRNLTGILVKDGTVYVFNPEFPEIIVPVNAGSFTSVSAKAPPEAPRPATEAEMLGAEKDASTALGKPKLSSDTKASELASITAGFQRTTSPNIEVITLPAVEVGRTTLSGVLVAGSATDMNYLSVFMRDVVFLAPSSGNKPSIWSANAINGSYSFGNHLNSGNITNTALSITNGSNINGTLQFNQFGGNWSATVNGSGTLSGVSYTGNIDMTGTASGTAGGGSFSGTGSGIVR